MVKEQINLSIAEYFRGKNIFLTGGSGFLGCVLIEALLSTTEDIGNIFVLFRDIDNKSAENRLTLILQKELFASHSVAALKKVIAVRGDITDPYLGISTDMRKNLEQKVNVVFHSAATINFNSTLKNAVTTNLIGTRNVLNVCKHMKSIESFIYMSTAFCNCTVKGLIAEKIYPTTSDPYRIMDEVENTKDYCSGTTSDLAKLLGSHPNTYTFSKQLTEQYLELEETKFPICIIRPSIVLGTLKTPVAGWSDNINSGACGFIAGCIKGVFRTMLADPELITDMTPCDHVSNMCLASAWHAGNFMKKNEIKVYHSTTGEENPITWSEYVDLVVHSARRHPCDELLWYPNAKARSSRIRNRIVELVFHIVPMYFLEILQNLLSHKTKEIRLLSIVQKYSRGTIATRYFTSQEFRFATVNSGRLLSQLTPADQEKYSFTARDIHWEPFIEDCVKGVRRYYFKESKETGARCQKVLRRHRMVHYFSYLLLFTISRYFFAWILSLQSTDSLQLSFLAYILAGLFTYFIHWL